MCSWGSGYGWLMMLVNLVIWLALIAGVVYLIVRFVKQPAGVGRIDETPLDILKKRYAKGEISEDDFNRMKSKLEE